MKLALLGVDDDALALVRDGGHELAVAYDVDGRAADVLAIAPGVTIGESWESLLLGTVADAVVVARGLAGLANQTGIPDEERRADQLRKLAQAAVPMIVVCPACESIVGFEIEMIARDTKAVIIPWSPGALHPAVARLAEIVSSADASSLGPVEQVVLERELADRSRDAVLVQLARDAALLRQIVGTIKSVTAAGAAVALGRDPLGPKPAELPSLANVSVQLTGDTGLAAWWQIAAPLGLPAGRLRIVGQHARAVLQMPLDAGWTLEISGNTPAAESYSPQADIATACDRVSQAAAASEPHDADPWLAACRDQEVAEAVDRSLARGRTIELFGEEHTEEASFKGVMAVGGCLLLATAIVGVLLATVVEGLQLPIRGSWRIWRTWPYLLLAVAAVFLALQLLKLVVKREPASNRPNLPVS